MTFREIAFRFPPEWSASIDYSYTFLTNIGNFNTRLIIKYVDDYFLDLANRKDITLFDDGGNAIEVRNLSYQPSYTTTDFYLTWNTEYQGLSIDFFVENIDNEAIKTGVDTGFFSSNGFSSFYLPPRTYGINLNLSF